ncbi:pseudouridine synthase [Neomoorella mulderi]|uniref:Pseudouridine synthase n=1 Tax=Moorella mulderi DSM 14980 TaxID=1122241 RepID=A0A151AZP3_9FIRM|nr:pseudouridine synthase [Moorella mulderi]KYH33023.1 ribosomal large subunit pseudouridine synthase B [Moorella mulderi DSM 14980]
MRLQKYLARAGVASRRHAEEMIRAGRVRVNGQIVTAMGLRIEPGRDEVTVDGRPVTGPGEKVYVLLYKPPGYVTTVSDPQGRPKVIDLVKDITARLYPVGRLDYATEGLLLLTNDGELTLRLTHPRYRIPKTYLALVKGVPDANTITHLRRGVKLEDGLTAPAGVRIRRVNQGNALLELTLREGRKREVRRMLATVGHPVIWLKRIKFAFLTLEGLKPGEYRRLTPAEVARLYRLVGLDFPPR